ncbi:MAG: BtaA family protein [Chthoniobacter sp.]|nr:BtaA family protein [Chthoniobacter sp.]
MNAEKLRTNPLESFPDRFLKAAGDLVFHHVHGGQLIYNTSWEDPRIDRQLLDLRPESRVVVITSAGCNVLDYLLDGPAEIHAVDVNYRQNALLELKLAMIRRGEFADLFEMFGLGSHTDYKAVYRSIRETLPAFARRYWDGKIAFFNPGSLKKSFYYHGTAGAAAWLLGGALFKTHPNSKKFAQCLLDADSLAQQRQVYARLEPQIWGDLSNWLIRQSMLMTLLGVPQPQVQLIEDQYPGGLGSYVKDKLRHVMCELPAGENYFWRVYLTGSYTLSCCPNYLREENQTQLARGASRVHTHTSSITAFLRENPGVYSHFVLLDHQDWLAWHDPAALREEWELILVNSRPGTRILMRSAALEIDFLPAEVRDRLRFFPELTEPLHRLDRVGTYGSLSFAEVL